MINTTKSQLSQLDLISKVQNKAIKAVSNHYEEKGLLEVPVPILVGITGACENVSTLFKLGDDSRIHLTQTGQLALEQALQFAKGVYCITKSFRTDFISERHLNEFTLIEEEISCSHKSIGMNYNEYSEDEMFDHLLQNISNSIKSMIASVLKYCKEDLIERGVNISRLETAVDLPFHRITYTDAIKLLNSSGNIGHVEWGEDLKSKHELLLIDLVANRENTIPLPTFVTHYPKEIKFFNMKEHEQNSEIVNSADLLLPGVGEAVGSAVREHNYEKLIERLLNSVMFQHIQEKGLATLEDFKPYLQVIEDKRTDPHAGYGIGLERVIQYILGEKDIRKCSVSYQLNELMGFNKELQLAQTGSNAPGF
ncbi:hypothetical protein PGC35_20280 [Psychrobacillus sp. PGGUH221]|uniref:amino acid--tRNA ligase-related protein n=1 Tax=Psychrobacillus sp. PGGUH221 TaxID=3020058 RepID=UPI0035C72ED5